MISIYEPNVKEYSTRAIEAIKSGWISNHGEFVENSTRKLKEILNIEHTILMANGTCTTHCLFLSLKFKYPEVKKIYVPNNAYVAAWNSALMVYSLDQLEVMKMDLETWNISTDEEYIKSLNTNSAVLIVHNLGNIINVPRLKKIRPDLIFVEDNCEGLFGKYDEIYSGMSEASLCSSCSFYGNKVITTGEGGAFFTNDSEVYEHIKKVYSQGMSNTRYLHDVHAYNYRMTNVQAAFLYDQLNDLERILTRKAEIFANYERSFGPLIKLGKVSLFKREEGTQNSHWIFAVRIVGNTKSIEETSDFFKNEGVDTRPFFYPIQKHGHLIKIQNNDETSAILNREVIMIPSSPGISLAQQQTVVQATLKFVLWNQGIKPVEINKQNGNIDLLDKFIPTTQTSKHFRYFNKRTSECIKDHILTLLFYDEIQDVYFGYTHIDYYEKHWFGIYIQDSYCGKKLGGLLLNYTLNHSTTRDITPLYLTVDIENEAATKLYEKNGFTKIHEYDTSYLMKKIV